MPVLKRLDLRMYTLASSPVLSRRVPVSKRLEPTETVLTATTPVAAPGVRLWVCVRKCVHECASVCECVHAHICLYGSICVSRVCVCVFELNVHTCVCAHVCVRVRES